MAATRETFTKGYLNSLPCPEKGNKRYYDHKTPGLTLTVTAKGAKTFYVYRKVNGKPEEVKVGPWPAMSIEQARKQAAVILADIARGVNPNILKRQLRAEPTFGELFAWFLVNVSKPKKKTWKEDEGKFKRHLTSYADAKASQITRAEMRALMKRIGEKSGPYAANRVLELVSVVYKEARKHDLISCEPPTDGVEAFPEKSRDRRLMPQELESFIEAVEGDDNGDIRDYVYLSLFTGARKSELLTMRWEQVDFTAATWRIPETKNGSVHHVPLEEFELDILRRRRSAMQSPWVFPGSGRAGHMMDPKAGWKRILARAGIKDLRLHDLRRSHGSLLLDSGASLAVIGKSLNHKTTAATQVYARLSLEPVRKAKREALAPLAPILGLSQSDKSANAPVHRLRAVHKAMSRRRGVTQREPGSQRRAAQPDGRGQQ